MSKCPNVNHPLYRKLEKALGEELAYQAYYQNDYNLPDYSKHPVYDSLLQELSLEDSIRTIFNIESNQANVTSIEQAKPFVPVNNDTVEFLGYDQQGYDRYTQSKIEQTQINIKDRKDVQFLKERFPDAPVDFYENVVNIGSQVAHGYMKNSAFYLWNHSEIGTAYHEAFHGLTQMYFTEAKRQSLYDIASEEFGIDRSNELAIEEQLAENFRDYMLLQEEASIPGRIKQFLKSLYYYVKSLVTDSVTMDQAFTMLETGRIPQQLKRNVSRFRPDTTLYSLREGMTPWEQKDMIDGIYSVYQAQREINLMRPENQQKSEADVLDDTRKYFLTHAFSGAEGLPIREARAKELVSLKKNDPDAFYEKLEQYDYYETPSDEALENVTADSADLTEIHEAYLDIAMNWETQDESDTGNFVRPGWKDIFIESLPEYGYEYSEYQIEHIGSEDTQERIYNRSSLEESMKDKLSGRVRQFIMSITDDSGFTKIGLKRKINPTKAYTDILQAVHNAESYSEMINNLKDARVYKPYLDFVLKRLEQSDDNLKSQFAVNFTQHYTDFMIMKQYKNTVSLFSANQNQLTTKILDTWRAEAVRDQNTSRDNLYIVDINEEGERSYSLNENVANKVQKPLKNLVEFYFSDQYEITDEVLDNFVDLLQSMSLFTGVDAKPMFKKYFEQGTKIGKRRYQGKDLLGVFLLPNKATSSSIYQLASSFANLKRNAREGTLTEFTLKDQPVNFFENRNNIEFLRQLADVQRVHDTDIVQSFLNSEKKTIYPYNMPTQLSDVMNRIQKGTFFDAGFSEDANYSPTKQETHQSPLYRLLKKSKSLRNQIELKKFDAIQTNNQKDGTTYREQAAVTAKITRINAFINDGDGVFSYFPLPTQSDRDFLAMIKLPRTEAWKSFGVTDMNLRNIVRNELISQIKRYQEAKEVIQQEPQESWIPNYHYKEVDGKKKWREGNAFKLTGLLEGIGWKKIDNVNIKDINIDDYLNDSLEGITKDQVDQLIDEYADAFKEKAEQAAVQKYQELLDLNIIRNENGNLLNYKGDVVKDDRRAEHPFGKKVDKYGSILDLMKQYELDSRVMKNEIVKLFYQNRDFFKNYDDFSKRAGLLTTPGLKPVIKGDVSNDWGLSPKINEIIINDTYNKGDDTSLYKWLKAKGVEWADEYKPGASNKTDAQGYMSIDAYREWQQAFGEWTPQHEQAYNNYKEGGKFQTNDGFIPKIMPIKPSVFGPMRHSVGNSSMIAPVSIKNSYMVLLREFTQEDGSPLRHFDNLRQRMELEGEYVGKGLDTIHWANTESTHKVLKTNIVDLDGTSDLSNVIFHQIPAELVRVPQVKPDKKSNDILIGSQTLRLLTSVINDMSGVEYRLSDGTKLSRDEWVSEYHNAVSNLVDHSINKLRNELKYAVDGVETGDQKIELLKNLRTFLDEQAKNSNRPLSDNQKKGLDIIEAPEGHKFRVPLAFPSFARKNEQSIFSIFRNNLIQQKIQGKQVVQAAELGDATLEGQLKFITLEGEKLSEGEIGNISKAEVAVSADIAKMLNIQEGDNLSELSDSVKSIMGYRIPTSGKNLMLPMVVKRILPENYKATVVVPGRITTQMGSDFDVDSLMLFVPHSERVDGRIKRLEYNEKNPTRKQLENRFMELMESVLTHPQHLQELVQPVEGDTLINLAKEFDDQQYDPNDPYTDVEYQIRNRDGAAGIGIYSNALMGYVTTQSMGLKLDQPLNFVIDGKNVRREDLSPIKDTAGISVEDNIRQHQIAALDNAKNPIMKTLNDNVLTSSSTIFLLTAGVDLVNITKFRTHPAIRKLVEEYENQEGKPYQIREIAEQVFPGVNDYSSDLDIDLNFDKLDQHTDQHIVSKFLEFTKKGSDFTKLSNIVTPNRISDMSSNAALASYQNQVDYINSVYFRTYKLPYSESKSKVETLDDLFPMNKAYRKAINEAIDFSKKFFPFHTRPVKVMKQDLLEATGKDSLSVDIHKSFHDFLFNYMMSIPDQDSTTYYDSEYAHELLIGENNLVTRVSDLKKEDSEFASNIFIAALSPSRHNPESEVKTFEFNAAIDYDKHQIDVFSGALLKLYEKPEYRDIAVDLMNYSIFTTGFSPAPNNFMNMIPIEMWENEGYSSKFYEQLNILQQEQDVADYSNIVDEFILHNVQTDGLLHSIKLKSKEHENDTFQFSAPRAQELGILTEENKIRPYVRAYNPDTKDFDLLVFHNRNETAGKISYTYLKTNQKGSPYKLTEANFQRDQSNGLHGSMLPSNTRTSSGAAYLPPKNIRKSSKTERQKQTRVAGPTRKTALQSTFENAGISVDIKIDNTLDSLGKVDITEDGITITMVSEDLRGPDTEIHEFGHIYVELLGYESDIIQEGINQLRNTDLWNEIKRLYPELSKENFEKEVLVTAIGEEGVTYLNQPWWKAWWNRMVNKVKEIFGIERNIAQQLAQEMLANDLRPIDTSKFVFDRTFRHRKAKKLEANRQLVKEMVVNLEKQIDQLRQLSKSPMKSAQAKVNLQKMLQRRLEEKFGIEQEVASIQDFVQHANRDFATLENQIEQLRFDNKTDDFMAKAGQMIQLVEHYQLLDDIKKDAKDLLDSSDNAETMELLKHTIELRDGVKEGINEVVIPVMAQVLSAKANPKIEETLNEFIKQIDEGYIPNERAIKKTSEYKRIQKNTALNKEQRQEQIKELAKRKLRERIPNTQNIQTMLRQATKGDNYYLWMIDPVIYSDDQAIQLFTLMVKDRLADARRKTLEWRDRLDKAYKTFVEKTGKNGWNNEKNHDMILEDVTYFTKQDGEWVTIKRKSFVQPYDIDRFNKNKYNLYRNLHKKYKVPKDADQFQEWKENNPDDYRAYKKELSRWYEENTSPTDNWEKIRDENWNKLSQIKEQMFDLDKQLAEGEITQEQHRLQADSLSQEESRLENWFSSNFADSKYEKPINELSRPAKGEQSGKKDYTNPKWEALQRPENKAYKEYHNTLFEYFKEMQDVYGRYNFQTNKWDDYSYYVPSVRKNDKDRLLENGIRDSAAEFKRNLTILDTDDIYAQYVDTQKRIPIYYANAVEAKDVSNDIPSSLLLFAKQAMEYEQLSNTLGHVYVMRNILENRQITETDSQGIPLFDKAFSKFGWKSNITDKTIAKETKHFKQWESWVDQIFFGQTSDPQMVGNFELNKVIRTLNKISAYNVFPFNLFQGIANVLIGNTYIIEEAIAGEHFTKKDYAVAQANLSKAIPGLLNDMGRTQPVSKLGQLIDMFDVQEGMTMQNMVSNVFNNRLKNMTTAEQTMFMQRSGELQMAVTPFLAIMNNIKVKDKSGNDISLYDAFTLGADGKLTLRDNIKLTKEEQNNITNQVNALNRSMQGIYDRFNASHLKKKWYGKAILLFRSWLLPTYRRFWGYNDGDFRLDHEMGSVREGIYITGIRFLRNMFAGADKFSMDAYRKMSEVERRNIKKFIAHMGTVALTMAIIGLISRDDDEEFTQADYYTLYWSHRLRSELMIFLNPVSEGQKLLRSPASNTMMITKVNKFMVTMLGDLGRLLTGEELAEYQRSIGQKEKGDSKLYWRFIDLVPGLNSIEKSLSPEESYKWYTQLF